MYRLIVTPTHMLEWDEAKREAWCDWARQHDLDPNEVSVHAPIIVKAGERGDMVTLTRYVRTEAGHIQVDMTGKRDKPLVESITFPLRTPCPER